MTDHTDLIARLRAMYISHHADDCVGTPHPTAHEAADALEAQAQRIAELEADIEDHRERRSAYEAVTKQRIAELEQYREWASPQIARPVEASVIEANNALQAERDALRADAERYRWMKAATPRQLADLEVCDLDAAVDAAMQGEK